MTLRRPSLLFAVLAVDAVGAVDSIFAVDAVFAVDARSTVFAVLAVVIAGLYLLRRNHWEWPRLRTPDDPELELVEEPR